jgi:hypothetical protein
VISVREGGCIVDVDCEVTQIRVYGVRLAKVIVKRISVFNVQCSTPTWKKPKTMQDDIGEGGRQRDRK